MLIIPNADRNAEKPSHAYMTGVEAKWYSLPEKEVSCSLKEQTCNYPRTQQLHS